MPKDATIKPPAKKAAKKAAPAKATSVKSPSATPAKAAAKKSIPHSPASAAAPTHQQIAEHAHHLWSKRGGHHGDHINDWLNAEEQLKAGK